LGPICHYVIVRADLPDGFREAQVGHAIGESLLGPHEPGTYVVVLAARDEAHLALEADRLEAAGVALTRVCEPDAPWCGALTALGLRPARKGIVGPRVRHLPRLRPP
jgi:hypothetical protein